MDKVFVIQSIGWPDIVNVGLVAVLVAATIFYARRTHDMVGEMREGRKNQLLPKLKLGLRHIGPSHTDVKIINVGPGPATDIEFELWFGQDTENKRQWTVPLMVSGEDILHFFPDLPKGGAATNVQFAELYKTISLKARYSDIFHQKHEIMDTLDFATYWNQVIASGQLVKVDNVEEIRRQTEKISKHLETIAKAAREKRTSR